jgi:DNA-directed RNA polymerase subunit M/transcription elongation factor TFIIS
MAAIDYSKGVPLTSDIHMKYNNQRITKMMTFGTLLNAYDEFRKMSYKEKLHHITAIEKACYNASIERANRETIHANWNSELFCSIYDDICYKIFANIDKGSSVANVDFGIKIIKKEIDFKHLPKMTCIEMCPGQYEEVLRRIEVSKNVNQTVKTSSMFKCSKCKESKCQVENLYNRSLDEGVNLKVSCLVCGFQFTA